MRPFPFCHKHQLPGSTTSSVATRLPWIHNLLYDLTGSFMCDLLNLPPTCFSFSFFPSLSILHTAITLIFPNICFFTMQIPGSNLFTIHQLVKYISNSFACLIPMPFCELSTSELPSIIWQPFPKQELSLSLICVYSSLLKYPTISSTLQDWLCLLMCANCQEGNDE